MKMNHSILPLFLCLVIGVIGFGPATSWAKLDNSMWIDPAAVRDEKARAAVGQIKTKLEPIKGYTASLVGTGFSPHGGLEPFPDEQWVRRPDRMLIKRKASSPYNSRLVMSLDVTIVIAGDSYLTKKGYIPLTPEQRKIYEKDFGAMLDSPSLRQGGKMSDKEKAAEIERSLKSQMQPRYTKIDLAAVAKSIPDFNTRSVMANNNNLLDPFAPVKMETLKIVKETPEAWVFQAEMKQAISGVKTVRMTFDRRTGFLSKVQWEIEMEGSTVIRTTLQVNKVTPMETLPDSLFNIELPQEKNGDLSESLVSDDTEMTIEDYRMNKKIEEESRKNVEAQKAGSAGK